MTTTTSPVTPADLSIPLIAKDQEWKAYICELTFLWKQLPSPLPVTAPTVSFVEDPTEWRRQKEISNTNFEKNHRRMSELTQRSVLAIAESLEAQNEDFYSLCIDYSKADEYDPEVGVFRVQLSDDADTHSNSSQRDHHFICALLDDYLGEDVFSLVSDIYPDLTSNEGSEGTIEAKRIDGEMRLIITHSRPVIETTETILPTL